MRYGVGLVSKTSSRVAARAVCRAPASTGFSVTPASSRRGRVSASEPTSSAIWSRRRVPPAVSTPPARTTNDGSTTETTAAMPSAKRSASVASSSSPGPGVVSALATAAWGVVARSPSERARASTERPPASSWKPPALPRRTSRTSGVPGSGRKPTSPAPPVAPPWTRPSMTMAAPIPSSAHRRTKSWTPRGQPRAHLGDRGEVDVVGDLERCADRLGEPVEQVRVVPAGQVPGVAQLPVRRVERARRADGEPVQPVAVDPGRGGGAVERVQHMVAPRRCRPCAGSSARSRRWCGR